MQASPVRRESLVGPGPQPIMRKKFELNPKFPAGVKFPSDWNNSKLSHYSKSIEKNTPSHSDTRKESGTSKAAKKRKQSAMVSFNTPEKKHDRKRHSQSSHRKSGESRSSDSSYSASRSRYDHFRSSLKRSPFKRSYHDAIKSSKSVVHPYKRSSHGRTSMDRISPSRRTPSLGTEKSKAHRDAKHSSCPKSTKDSDKKSTRVSPSIYKEKNDSLTKHAEQDHKVHDERCVKPIDSEAEIGSEEKHTSELSSPSVPPDPTKKLNLSKNKDLGGVHKELTNSIKDSRAESTLSDVNKVALPEAKKSNKIHKRNSTDLQKPVLNKDVINKLQKELPDKLKSSICNVRDVESHEESMADLADKSHEGDFINTKVTPTRKADKSSNLSGSKNSNLEEEKSNSLKDKDSLLKELKLKWNELSDISKQGKSSLIKTKLKSKTSLPIKKVSKLPVDQVSPSTNSHLNEKISSPCSNPPSSGKNTKSDKVLMKSPDLSLIDNGKTSTSKSITPDLMQTKEKLVEKNVNATELAHEVPTLAANKQNDVSDKQKVMPDPLVENVSNMLENVFKKARALELKKATEKCSNTSTAESDETIGDDCNAPEMNEHIKNVSPTSSIPIEKKTSEPKTTKDQCSSVISKTSASVNKTLPDNSNNTNKQIETVCATSCSALGKKTKNDKTNVKSSISNSIDSGKTSGGKSTVSSTSELIQTKENSVEKNVNRPLQNKHSKKESVKHPKESKQKKVKVKNKLVNDTEQHPPKRKQKNISAESELNIPETSEKCKHPISEADLSRTSADEHEIEEAVASISSGAGAQVETPKKNQMGSNCEESQAAGPSSGETPKPEQENVHSNLISDLACSSEAKNEKEAENTKDISDLLYKINEVGLHNLLDIIRRKQAPINE